MTDTRQDSPEPNTPSEQWAQVGPEYPPEFPVSEKRVPAAVKAVRKVFILGSVVGALVGALVASLISIAVLDKNGVNGATEINFSSNTSKITEPADIQEVLAKVEPSVVAITTGAAAETGTLGNGGAAGTGFVISKDGYIATNDHVIADASGKITVQFINGEQFAAELVGRDETSDLAVIKVDAGDNLAVANFGNSSDLVVGDAVIAIGNALALEGGPSVTSGIVSALNRQITEDTGAVLGDVIQTDAAINSGNSGGPLVNSDGKVVGINTAVADPSFSQNIGFAISINYAKSILDDLKAGDREVAFLGVATITVTKPIANEQDLAVDKGALVRQITEGSPAGKAGIKVEDVIVKVDDKSVDSAEDVVSAVRAKKPDDKITIVVNRDGEERSFDVALTGRPSAGE